MTLAFFLIALSTAVSGFAAGRPSPNDTLPEPVVVTMLQQFCLECHNRSDSTAGLNLESVSQSSIAQHGAVWEKVVRKLRARQMPPHSAPRPGEAAYVNVLSSLEKTLDQFAVNRPQPGRTDTFRRLTRTEYRNVIRDLLCVDVDAKTLLPADESSLGFDNITVGQLSPTLLNRYVSAAQKISRMAVGRSTNSPDGTTIRIRPDVTQEERVDGLPVGTRGGALISHTFPQDGEYEIRVRLARDRNEHVEGLREPHELELLLDLDRVALLTVHPLRGTTKTSDDYATASHESIDRHLRTRITVSAGPHQLGVTFLKHSSSLLETRRQPLNVHFNMYRHPRIGPAVYQVSIFGPFNATGPGDTPSRRRIFSCQPTNSADEDDCARRILSLLLRRACRRPVEEEDLVRPLLLYREARAQGSFEDGIEMALSSVLVHPRFLFRIEQDPADVAPQTAYHISDVELASRLSFFLWSSLPDDELLDVAERGLLADPDVLESQTRRMLADDRARALVSNFAGQWLYLRNLDSITPDARLFPDFDDNLRQAFRRETELLLENIMSEDRSVLNLLKSDATWLNARLAKHYGIPHVYGSRFRKVRLSDSSNRGGLLRHGSILTVTSYATRTSPVLRGKWVLENILGTPPPPPPADVPSLDDNTVAVKLSVRERLAQHRKNPACAGCHDLIDPVGLSLEQYDAVGRWREFEEGRLVDASGGLPDGRQFTGVAGLEQGLLDRPENFVGTMVEKLLTYALGRGMNESDGPAIRHIMRDAKAGGFRFSALILGIVKSAPFQMRTTK